MTPAGTTPQTSTALGKYQSLSLRRLLRHGSAREKHAVLGAWLLSLMACVGFGLATVIYQWSGMPLNFGGATVYITVYPPLLICLWWTLCLGWAWGAVPAYIATLSLALYAQMPWYWAVLFACANPLGLAALTISYQSVPMSLNMRSPQSLLFYVLLSFVASVFSSSGALIWSYTNRIDSIALLPIWQGWWLGGFLQSVLLVGPLLSLSWPRITRWLEQRSLLQEPIADAPRRQRLRLIALVVAGVLIYGWLTVWLGTRAVEAAMQHDPASPLSAAANTLAATSWVFFWVSALLVMFGGFFGYRSFTYWFDANARLLAELTQMNVELRAAAGTDILSGLLNRRSMGEALGQHSQRALRFGESSALLMLDIDHFKSINDRYGHDVGDAVIQALSQTITASIRSVDLAARWGGEEFLLALPQVDRAGALVLAERLRHSVAQINTPIQGHTVSFTISVGIAMFDAQAPEPMRWLKRADEALYAAKSGGRNRVLVWEDLNPV